MSKRLLVIDDNTIVYKRIKSIRNGMIETWTKETYPIESAEKKHGRHEYYVIGSIDVESEAFLQHSQNLFKSMFFKALVRDKLTMVEFIVIVIAGGSAVINVYMVIQFQQFLNALSM
ncbi:hypothetical protein [Vallitalea okinawensis]|uniref:hypothetical protein n=1 Tax=Vallitalea okinawensis TaxID=2078660 RepID=UPI000CFA88F9|nr:hypothetical protein [Vallitalea okinawensis]